jgi:wyosine [tRNA(Phe)-imidazoG37] synthetase (radical SAM superfamily)
MLSAYQIFKKKIPHTELLIDYEGDDFATAGAMRDELLSILSVHPIREKTVESLLKKSKEGREVIDELIKEKKILLTDYRGEKFYLLNIKKYVK